MLRAITLFFLTLPALAPAAIWPEQWWEFKRGNRATISPDDKLVWEEYGLQEAESASYTDGKINFAISGWRLRDSTSALAVAQWILTPSHRPADFEETAWQSGRNYIWCLGNYVFRLEGDLPDEEKRHILYIQLPRLERAALPTLAQKLPAEGLIPGSARYVVGPVSLEKFEPRIAPSIAAFHVGAEAQLAHYQSSKGEFVLAVFNYPTPAIAKKQVEEFSKLDGVIAKRTGPLVALTVGSPDRDAQERVLAKVNYQASVSWNEPVNAAPEPNMGDVMLGAFKLVGFLALLTFVGGFLIFGVKAVGQRWFGWTKDEDAMLTLHIEDRPR